MNKILFFSLTLFLALSGAKLLAQDIMVMQRPARNCTECDTLRLEKGKPTVLFVSIGSRKMPIETAGSYGIPYREWKELESNFGEDIDLKYMNSHGIVVLGDSKLMDFRDTDSYFGDIYYWDGNDTKLAKMLNYDCYLAEQIGVLINKKAESSYKKQFEADSLLFENLIKNNTPSKALIENIKYHDEFRAKGVELFPYQFLDLNGIKKVEISNDSLFEKNIFRISFTPQQLIDTISNYRQGEDVNFGAIFEYKNGTLLRDLKSENRGYAYKGDSLITYHDGSNSKSFSIKVLVNNMFIPIFRLDLDTKRKRAQKSFSKIEEGSDGSLTLVSETGEKKLYSNTKWESPLTLNDRGNNMDRFSLLQGENLILKREEFWGGATSPSVEILYTLDNGKVVLADIKHHRKKTNFRLYYRYSYY